MHAGWGPSLFWTVTSRRSRCFPSTVSWRSARWSRISPWCALTTTSATGGLRGWRPAVVQAADAGQAFALVVVDELARHGVTDAVIAPGSRSTPLALAFAADDRIRLHVRIDERSAAFTAVGLARVTGRVVPALCTSGTAAAHFHAAVLECDASRVPLMVLTADRPPELRGTGANQTLDQIKMYGAAVRHFAEVGVPESRPGAVGYWRAAVSAAVAAASGALGPAGPVHLNLALREPLVPTPDAPGFPYPLDGRAAGRPWTTADAMDRRVALPPPPKENSPPGRRLAGR